MFFDLDWSFYALNRIPVSDILTLYGGERELIQAAVASQAGRDAFLKRYAYLMETILNEEYITGQIERNQIRDEIFEYVSENKDEIELTDTEHRQYFEYADKGFIDAGVIYGYFYSPHDEYQNYTRTYRNGYLRYGSPNSGEDWCYFEKICDNWYYYEEHYG